MAGGEHLPAAWTRLTADSARCRAHGLAQAVSALGADGKMFRERDSAAAQAEEPVSAKPVSQQRNSGGLAKATSDENS
jgi:hypothetical protein